MGDPAGQDSWETMEPDTKPIAPASLSYRALAAFWRDL